VESKTINQDPATASFAAEEHVMIRYLRASASFLIALVAAVVVNFPALRAGSKSAGYLFTGDVLGLYWPSLYKVRNLIAHGHFTAIDFSHFNGSADFFLTPNIYSVYPPFVLYSVLSIPFNVLADDIGRLLTWILALNFFLAVYFSIRLTTWFLKWDLWQASLAAIFFGCSVYFVSTLGEPHYLLCAAPVPWIAYAALRFAQSPSMTSFVLATVPVVFTVLGGYLPIGLSATAFGLVTSVLILSILSSGTQLHKRGTLLRLVLPAIAAIAVVSPFLAESYRFLQDSPSAATPNLYYSAHQLTDIPQAILRVFSYRYTVPGPFVEMSASIGLIGLMILVLFFFRRDITEGFEQKEIQAIAICIGLYSLFVLITYGQFSPLSDAFFYFVPQVGKMHIYQRFLMMSHIFLALALAIILNGLTRSHRPESGRTALILTAVGLFAIALTVARYPETAQKNGLSGYTIFEFLGLFIFLALYRTSNRIATFLSAIVLMNLTALDVMYDWSLEANDVHNNTIRNPVALDKSLQSRIVQFMRKYSKKDLVKYVDLSPMWNAEGVGPFPKSFPYWVENQISLSSYHGFNFYLSTRRDYMSFMPIGANYTLQPNWQWLESTGADFAIVEAAALDKGAFPGYLLTTDASARFALPNNLVIVPLKQTFIEPADLYFDNGVFRAHRAGAIGGSTARVVGSSVNLALKKPTRESSQWGNSSNFGSALAVDGNTNGDLAGGSVFHTQPERSPWLEVDLGRQENLGMVRIWNRTDCCQERLSDYWIFLSDTPFPRDATAATLEQNPKIARKHVLTVGNPFAVVSMGAASGRYLRVQADAPSDTRVLHFAELEVFGPPATQTTAVSDSAVPRATGSGNFANEYSISIENDRPVTVEYLMSYNPRLHFYVNGRETVPGYGPGTLAKFDLSPGKNLVEVRYRNMVLGLFWVFYAVYAAIVAFVFGKCIWTTFRRTA
jgi:hypothetical protein